MQPFDSTMKSQERTPLAEVLANTSYRLWLVGCFGLSIKGHRWWKFADINRTLPARKSATYHFAYSTAIYHIILGPFTATCIISTDSVNHDRLPWCQKVWYQISFYWPKFNMGGVSGHDKLFFNDTNNVVAILNNVGQFNTFSELLWAPLADSTWRTTVTLTNNHWKGLEICDVAISTAKGLMLLTRHYKDSLSFTFLHYLLINHLRFCYLQSDTSDQMET